MNVYFEFKDCILNSSSTRQKMLIYICKWKWLATYKITNEYAKNMGHDLNYDIYASLA